VGDGKRDLKCNSNKEVILMTLRRHYGHLPAELGLLSQLKQLNVSAIPLSGTIPTEIALLTGRNFRSWDLKHNTLSGSIPTELGLSTELSMLVFNNNTLSGTIPMLEGSRVC
jgi:hypothetical protein